MITVLQFDTYELLSYISKIFYYLGLNPSGEEG